VPESLETDIFATPAGYSYSAYLSGRFRLSPKFTIDAGLRWDQQTYTKTKNENQLSPRINLLYTLIPGLDMRLTWGRYYQSQGIGELQVEDGVDHYFPAQNTNQFIAGLSSHFGDAWSLRVELYNKNYADLRPRFENLLDPIPLIPELAPDWIRVAPTSGRARGLELTLGYDVGKDFNWWASYTFSRVTDHIDGDDELRNWDQTHAFQAGLAWHRKNWEFGFAANIHTGWPTTLATLETDDNGDLQLVFDPRNHARLNTFASIDFKATRIWQFEKSRISAFVEFSNLLNRQNQCCVDYDVEEEDGEDPVFERSIDSWLGIVPAVGLLLEF
jgi:outer membrane receptor protein involved in Fe transport